MFFSFIIFVGADSANKEKDKERFRCGFQGCTYKTGRMFNYKRHMFTVHLKKKVFNKRKKPLPIQPKTEESVFADPLAFP